MEVYEKIFEVSTTTRDILVVAILGPDSLDIYNDETFCYFHPPKKIPYKITLKTVRTSDLKEIEKFKKDFENLDHELTSIMSQSFNRMVIYIKDSLGEGEKLLEWLYKQIGDTPIRKTLYNAQTTISYTQKQYPKIYRTYNIEYQQVGKAFMGKFVKNKDTLFVGLYPVHTSKLSCLPWFNLFLNTVNKCGYRRLMQNSGTCYLNSCINAFVLSKRLRKNVIRYMRGFLTLFPETESYVKSPLTDVLPCPSRLFMTAKFFYRLMYNLCCKETNLYTRKAGRDSRMLKEDILAKSAYELFALNKQTLAGNPLLTLQNILSAIGMPFAYVYGRFDGVQLKKYEKNHNGINPETNKRSHEPEGLIYDGPFSSRYINYQHINFYLEAVLIDIYIVTGYHSMVGFFCEGIPKIYDPNGMIYEYDWTNLIPAQFFSTVFLKHYGDSSQFKIVNVNYIYASEKFDAEKVSCP